MNLCCRDFIGVFFMYHTCLFVLLRSVRKEALPKLHCTRRPHSSDSADCLCRSCMHQHQQLQNLHAQHIVVLHTELDMRANCVLLIHLITDPLTPHPFSTPTRYSTNAALTSENLPLGLFTHEISRICIIAIFP